MSSLGTTCHLHQTLATNNRALLASGLKMTRLEHKDGDAAARHDGPMAAADASQAPVSPPHAAASAVPAAHRPPAWGQPRLPVSFALNSAPTRATAAARHDGQGRQRGSLPRLSFLRGGGPSPLLSCVLLLVEKHQPRRRGPAAPGPALGADAGADAGHRCRISAFT